MGAEIFDPGVARKASFVGHALENFMTRPGLTDHHGTRHLHVGPTGHSPPLLAKHVFSILPELFS
jgi:hypothetical protein